MDNNLRGAIHLAGTRKIRAILRRMMVLDRPGKVLLHANLATFGIKVLHTDCRSGAQIDKCHCCGDGQVINSSWLRVKEVADRLLK